ncbi:MAG: DUF2953 domain-containing protein [Clostridia bacterium]|nr:DUF2953 domain-containing protein [Clostridia bacterium]
MILLTILGYMLLSLLLLLLLILIIPIRYSLLGAKEETILFQAEISWLFNGIRGSAGYTSENGFSSKMLLVGREIRFNEPSDKTKQRKREKKETSVEWKDVMNQEFLNSVLQFLKDFFKHSMPQRFEISGRYGFEDPFVTGIACSFISALNLPNINIVPEFEDEILEGRLLIQGRLILGVITILFVRFLLTKPVRNIIKKMMRKKKGDKINVNESREFCNG